MIRDATPDDVHAMGVLAAHRRRVYSSYEPQFWKVAADADEVHPAWLAFLVGEESVISLVAEHGGELAGFAIATIGPAPPVYDPGGPTAMIDDFAVTGDTWPTVGTALLEAATARARERGATQVVVVCGHRDEPKRAALQAAGLSLASEWYTGPTERA